jgi:hypothetical protein
MINKYFIFEITVILLFIIFIVIKVFLKMSKLRTIVESDKLKNTQDDLIKYDETNCTKGKS